jgi:DNA-binding MarR family transcriptional regulator
MDTNRRELLDLLACLGRALHGDLRLRAGAAQLQPVHLQALIYLRDANRYSNTPQALAEYLGSTKGTVSQSLLWLYRRGLIERRPDERDGRVVRLGLSPEALAVLNQGGEDEAFAAAGTISDKEVNELLEILTRLLRAMQTQRGGRSFGVCQTCAHFMREGSRRFRCGLTGEELSREDSLKICREHSIAAAQAASRAP